jgi:hypothetical protein
MAREGLAVRDVFCRNMALFLKDWLDGSAASQKLDDEFDGEPRALDHGLADDHLRVHRDPRVLEHRAEPLQPFGPLSLGASVKPGPGSI